MDYFEGVVREFLRADRALFLNTECCIQINAGDNPDTSGPHWYCDALAIDLRSKRIFLCEVSYARKLDSLVRRLAQWAQHWPALRLALARDCHVDAAWPVMPWIFVPARMQDLLNDRLPAICGTGSGMPYPRITHLEDVLPWKYSSWNRIDTALYETRDDKVHMALVPTRCNDCAHRTPGGAPTCEAFPSGIPLEILLGQYDHQYEYPGDQGITWTPPDSSSPALSG